MSKGIAQGASWFPYLVLFIFGALAICSAFLSSRKKELFEQQTGIGSVRNLSWAAFEALVGETYRRQGYRIEESLEGGADGGVDLVLHKDGRKTIVQCKQWRASSVGAPVVREIYGVQIHEEADRAIIITSGHFTREAESFAHGKPMELIDGPKLWEMVRGLQGQALVDDSSQPKNPECPNCGAPMVLRVAQRGSTPGSKFWGCSTYPKCHGSRSVD